MELEIIIILSSKSQTARFHSFAESRSKMTIIIMKMSIKGSLWICWDGISRRKEKDKKGYQEVKRVEVYYMCTYEDSITKPAKHCLRNTGRNMDQG
jgi:hypothetical protein